MTGFEGGTTGDAIMAGPACISDAGGGPLQMNNRQLARDYFPTSMTQMKGLTALCFSRPALSSTNFSEPMLPSGS
jgi:hypothetical protein